MSTSCSRSPASASAAGRIVKAAMAAASKDLPDAYDLRETEADMVGGVGCEPAGVGGGLGHGAHLASWAGSRKIARTRGGAARKRTMSDCTTSTRSSTASRPKRLAS